MMATGPWPATQRRDCVIFCGAGVRVSVVAGAVQREGEGVARPSSQPGPSAGTPSPAPSRDTRPSSQLGHPAQLPAGTPGPASSRDARPSFQPGHTAQLPARTPSPAPSRDARLYWRGAIGDAKQKQRLCARGAAAAPANKKTQNFQEKGGTVKKPLSAGLF